MTQAEIMSQWQSQQIDSQKVPVEYFRHRSQILARQTKRENVGAYISVVLMAGLAVHAFIMGKFWNAAALLYMTGIAVYAVKYFVRPAIQRASRIANESGIDALSFYRIELQRKIETGKWRAAWPNLMLAIVGAVLVFGAQFVDFPQLAEKLIIPELIFTAVLVPFALLERKRDLAKLQLELDALGPLDQT